jgi:hypothetical protein
MGCARHPSDSSITVAGHGHGKLDCDLFRNGLGIGSRTRSCGLAFLGLLFVVLVLFFGGAGVLFLVFLVRVAGAVLARLVLKDGFIVDGTLDAGAATTEVGKSGFLPVAFSWCFAAGTGVIAEAVGPAVVIWVVGFG